MCKNLVGGDAMGYMSNVIGGRFFEGKTYININTRKVTEKGENQSIVEHCAEYVIENNKIISVELLIVRSGVITVELPAVALIRYDYTYGIQTINDVPSSLEGYTI